MEGLGKRWKVLVIEDDASRTSLLATFLASMGCQCRGTTSRDALGTLEQEDFDAVLLDIRCSEVSAEGLVSAMEDAGCNVWRRMVVISDEDTDAQTTKLIQWHDLVGQVSRHRLFQELWSRLQSAFAASRWRAAFPGGAQIARLVFDSFRQPLPAGVRTLRASARQLVYEHRTIRVDMALEPLVRFGRIALAGQVLSTAEPRDKTEGLPVALLGPGGLVQATTTNPFGEFALEVSFLEDADLQIGVAEKSWLILSLGDFAAKRYPRGPEVSDRPSSSSSR
jgi:DNA-binding NarL/FixJ family response regulator